MAYPQDPPPPRSLSESDARTWATFAHLGILVGLIIPLGSVLTPLLIWMTQREKSDFVDHHGKEALNFQITMLILMIVGAILAFFKIGFVLVGILAIINFVFSVIAAISANKGDRYKYPYTLRLIV